MPNCRWPEPLITLGCAAALFALVGCQAPASQQGAVAPAALASSSSPAVVRPHRTPVVTMALPRNTGPAQVAAAFAVAYVSYRSDEPGPAYRAVTTAPYATAALSSALTIPAPGGGVAWRDVVATRAHASATVEGVRLPDGAPSPGETADFIVVLTRTTTSTRGITVDHPAVYTRLDRTADGWRVAALLN